MNHYQAAIIGFGKAGKTLAAALGRAGWRVAIIEKSRAMYGGTCINVGCIPTKALVHDVQHHANFSDAMQRKAAVVVLLREKNYLNLAAIAQVDVIDGEVEFVDAHTLKITSSQKISQIHAERIFINSGAEAVFPVLEGLVAGPRVVDSSGILNLTQLPQRLGILGGGYIGVEFASMFAGIAVVDNGRQQILGVALLAADSHEVINIVKTVMDAGLPYSVLRDQIFTHPTMSESLNDLFALVK